MSSGMGARLADLEYRREYGSENAKFETAVALAQVRELAGLTQAALAKEAGVSQAYIAKLERGDANPTVGQLGRMLAAIWLQPKIAWEPLTPVHEFYVVSEGLHPSAYEDFMINQAITEGTGPLSDVNRGD